VLLATQKNDRSRQSRNGQQRIGREAGLIRQWFMHCYPVCVVAAACLLFCPQSSLGQAQGTTEIRPAILSPPAWAFPVNPPNLTPPPVSRITIRVPNSAVTFLPEQLTNLFSVPDWHPTDHPLMPEVVAHGRKPGVYACGYCHLPDGAGRPENASLAGLPAAYIAQQIADFRDGARRTAMPTRLPPKLMTELSALVTDAEITAAAEYFSRLQPQFLIKVIETDTVPHTHVAGWILVVDNEPTREPIGQRIIEIPESLAQFERRDARSGFVAYVPVGAVAAGKVLVESVAPNKTLPCASCHGPALKGTGNIPGIAGRSPSYIMRQLFDIQSGLRAGTDVAPMTAVVMRLSTAEMIEISSYLATLR
jgi:cytochrome c553